MKCPECGGSGGREFNCGGVVATCSCKPCRGTGEVPDAPAPRVEHVLLKWHLVTDPPVERWATYLTRNRAGKVRSLFFNRTELQIGQIGQWYDSQANQHRIELDHPDYPVEWCELLYGAASEAGRMAETADAPRFKPGDRVMVEAIVLHVHDGSEPMFSWCATVQLIGSGERVAVSIDCLHPMPEEGAK